MTVPPTIRVDRRSVVPLQRQIFEAFRQAIEDGTLKAGMRLPPTRDLARELRVSRNSVINAFRYLAAQGLVDANSGAGTRVVAHMRRRVPPSWRPRRGRAGRIARIVTDASSGIAGAFAPGVPAIDLFPTGAWRLALNRRWRSASPSLLGYNEPFGFHALRALIAAHLGSARGMRCDADQIVVVNGAQHAIDLAARVLLERSDVAFVEDPGYLGCRSAFAMTGARVAPISVDENGFCLAAARQAALSPRLIYVTPSHQYPLGITMSLARRKELLAFSFETGAWIVEDDYDSDLRRDGRELPAIHSLDRKNATIYIGSFSHMLAPVLRIGYIVVPYDLIEAFRVVAATAGRGPSVIEQAALADFMARGDLTRHIHRLRNAYGERQAVLLKELSTLPSVESVTGRDAGSHVIVRLKRSEDESRLSTALARRGIEVPTVRSYGNADGLIFGYGSTDISAIRAAMTVVRQVRASLDR